MAPKTLAISKESFKLGSYLLFSIALIVCLVTLHRYIISEKARYMEDLVQDFNLTFRLKNDALPLNRVKNDVIEIVRRSVIDAANLPYTKHQQIYFISDQSTLYYELDPTWFKRAVDNLIMNSIIHNPSDTTVTIKVENNKIFNLDSPSPLFYITIQDNGVGMTKLTQEHLFDRYYRGTNTNESHSGTGLGMIIAKQLIQAHKGSIYVESKLGEGTKITLSFFGKLHTSPKKVEQI